MAGSAKDVFISYRNDGVGNNFAARITRSLQDSGYSVYFNPVETRSSNFPDRLKTAIQSCKDFLCIVTEDYLRQLQQVQPDKISWVREELLCARACGKNIVPVLVDGTRMPAEATLPEELQFFPRIDACSFSSEQYLRSPFDLLCHALRSKNDGMNGFRDVYNSSEVFDPDQALQEILKKANEGDERAMLDAGVYYFYGIAGERNERQAARWFKKISAANGPCATAADKFLAQMYFTGSVPREPQSYKKAYTYYQKAAAAGDRFSAGKVGYMQTIGSGCDFDYAATEAYYLPLLDTLDNPQKDAFARFYLNHGDFQKAARIYESIADTYPEAAFQMGSMYRRGVLSTPFQPDYFKASYYFQKSLDLGFKHAAHELGNLYFNPVGDFPKDFVKAQNYFKLAADAGNVNSQYMFAYMCEYGYVAKDIPAAIQYYEKANNQGHVLSAVHLAQLYQLQAYHNYEKAFQKCQYAAQCGDTISNFLLGTMYLCGRGCVADPDKAYLCFQQAAERGSAEAAAMLHQMDDLGI